MAEDSPFLSSHPTCVFETGPSLAWVFQAGSPSAGISVSLFQVGMGLGTQVPRIAQAHYWLRFLPGPVSCLYFLTQGNNPAL